MSEAQTEGLLSVVVVAYAGPVYLARCLAALDAQMECGSVEVIVAYSEGSLTEANFVRHPNTRWVCDASTDPARLRALGVAMAQGETVAVTEDHCVPSPTWIREIRKAHREHESAALGGPLEKLTPDSALNWAGYLLEFGRYQPPVHSGDVDFLSDCNVSYKRAALERIRDVWTNAFHETTTHWALIEHGERLFLDSRPVVAQQRSVNLWGGFSEKVSHGAVFGLTRVKVMSAAMRLVRIVTIPVLPFLLTGRTVRTAISRGHGGPAFRAAVPIFLFASGWALGELGAYLGVTRAARD